MCFFAIRFLEWYVQSFASRLNVDIVAAIQREMRKGKTHELSPGQLYLSGAGGGLGNSILVGPVEHIRSELDYSFSPIFLIKSRVRLQSQSATSGSQQYSGPIDAVKKIFR